MKQFTVYLVATRKFHVRASSVQAAEAVALAETSERWPGLQWLVSDTEEEA